MNTVYDVSFKVLKGVIKDKEYFAASLKKNSSGIKREKLPEVTSLSGLFLRNYYLIETVSHFVFNTTDVEPLIYIGLVYINNSYKKAYDQHESTKYLAQKLALYQIKFTDETKALFDAAVNDKHKFLSDMFNPKGEGFKRKGDLAAKYLSARNNLPVWVVKQLLKTYDGERKYNRDNIAFKTINAMTKMPKQFGIVNNLMIEEKGQDFYKNFEVVDNDFLEYKVTTSIRKNPFVRNGEILPIQHGEYSLIKILPQLHNGNIAFYFEDRAPLYAAIAEKYKADNKVTFLGSNPRLNPELFTKIQSKKPENITIIPCDDGEISANLSEKQNIFVFMPKSSNLEQLRRTPEYGLLFDTKTLDSIIDNQINGLLNIADHVEDGGYLVYAVSTFNIKETLLISKKFIANRPDFEHVGERIFFPYEKENSVFYYSLFRKKAAL